MQWDSEKVIGSDFNYALEFSMVAFLGLVHGIPLPESKPLDSFTLSAPTSEVVSLQKLIISATQP